MEVDDNVVDLSLGSGRDSLTITQATVRDLRALTQNSGLTITAAPLPSINQQSNRRVLRPRTETRSYVESPDIVLLPAKLNGRQQNGNIDSDSENEEMPPLYPIKVNIFNNYRLLRRCSIFKCGYYIFTISFC